MNEEDARKVVISVDLITDGDETSAAVGRVRNSMGDDITDDFKAYAHKTARPLTTAGEIQSAATAYANERRSILP